MTNGNGWLKPVLVGVAIFVLGAAIVGGTTNSFSNSIDLSKQGVKVERLETNVDANTKKVDGIDVMAAQINNIEKDVGKILDKLDK